MLVACPLRVVALTRASSSCVYTALGVARHTRDVDANHDILFVEPLRLRRREILREHPESSLNEATPWKVGNHSATCKPLLYGIYHAFVAIAFRTYRSVILDRINSPSSFNADIYSAPSVCPAAETPRHPHSLPKPHVCGTETPVSARPWTCPRPDAAHRTAS